eukprot:1081910-Ditylum_brightwellii.AAC.1
MLSARSCHSCKGLLDYLQQLPQMPCQHPKLARHWEKKSLTNFLGQLFVNANNIFCIFCLSPLLSSNICIFTLKTALGVSDKYYQHCTTFPIYGSSQGATNLPGIWLTISSIIGDIYEQSANSAEFISPGNAIALVLEIHGFVDNVTNQANMFTDDQVTTSQLLLKMREDSQLWSILLWLMGGLLELNKCSYHTIHFLFYPVSTPQMQLQQPDRLLRIHKADTSKNVQINYKSVFNPHKTLGHYKALDGAGRIQTTVLAEQDEKYVCRFTKSALIQHEASIYYTSCYQKSMGYLLGQLFFSRHILDKIGQKVLRAFTAKCRYNRNMTYTIQDGPSHLGGCEFKPLYHM